MHVYVYVYVYVYVCTSRSSWVFINLTTTIAIMVGGSHTLVHVPAKCPPQLHRCLRAGDSPQSPFPPDPLWTQWTRCCREEELLALWNCCHQLEREDAHRSLMINLAYICFFLPPLGVCSYSVLVSNPQGMRRDLKERGCTFRHLTCFRQLHLVLRFALFCPPQSFYHPLWVN